METGQGLGGTCVNVGCIPKKLMHISSLYRETQVRRAFRCSLFTVPLSWPSCHKLSFALPMFPCYRFFTFCIVLPVVTCFLPSTACLFWCVASKAWQQADSHCPSPPSPSLKVPGWCTRHGLGNKVFSQLRPEKQRKSGSGIRLKGRTNRGNTRHGRPKKKRVRDLCEDMWGPRIWCRLRCV